MPCTIPAEAGAALYLCAALRLGSLRKNGIQTFLASGVYHLVDTQRQI
jgi:hypothetical protein